MWIPVRMPLPARGMSSIGMEMMSGGIGRGRATAHESWSEVYVPIGDVPAPSGYRRIDLKLDRTWQPALYIPGNADLRMVGVQVGEPRFERRH